MKEEERRKIAYKILERMDYIIPKYWNVALAKDKPGTYVAELRDMIMSVLEEAA